MRCAKHLRVLLFLHFLALVAAAASSAGAETTYFYAMLRNGSLYAGRARVDTLWRVIYPRKASRFHVVWEEELHNGGRRPMLTSVDLQGRVLHTGRPPMVYASSRVLPHHDGKSFWVYEPHRLSRVDAESLEVRESRALRAFFAGGMNLGVVDLENMTIVRERPFPEIGYAVDFVNEP
jgi:hypothetical protein